MKKEITKGFILPVGVFLFATFAIWFGSKQPPLDTSGLRQDQIVKDPVLLESVGRFNIVSYRGKFYGLPKSLGAVDWVSGKVSTLPGVVTAPTLKEVKTGLRLQTD